MAAYRQAANASASADEEPNREERPEASSRVSLKSSDLLKRVQSDGRSHRDAWDAILSSDKVGGAVLAEAFLRLHNDEEYDCAIEGIKAALRHDHAQPWMYDVLALEMTLAGRPEEQINRVLLSRVDFTAGDPAQMLITASMLSRLQAFPQALRILHEAVRRNPYQPAVWELARQIALRSKDPQEIAWACSGTITNVWEGDYEVLHAACQTELEDLARQLSAAQKGRLASDVVSALNEAKQRDLRVTVSWAGDADLDLIVHEPNGQRCSYRQRMTTNGGALIRQAEGGKTRRSGTQSEEYVISRAVNGEYTVVIRYISGRVIGGKVKVKVVRYEGSDHEQTQTLTPEIGAGDPRIRVDINRGRAERSAK